MGEVDHSSSRDHAPSAGSALEASAKKTINDAAYVAMPDVTEPMEYEGRTLNRITADNGHLRFMFAWGANWMAGETWAQNAGGVESRPLPRPPLSSAMRPHQVLRDDQKDLSSDLRASLLLEALKKIANESVFNQLRYAEDSDTDYFLRCFKAVKECARTAIQQVEGK